MKRSAHRIGERDEEISDSVVSYFCDFVRGSIRGSQKRLYAFSLGSMTMSFTMVNLAYQKCVYNRT